MGNHSIDVDSEIKAVEDCNIPLCTCHEQLMIKENLSRKRRKHGNLISCHTHTHKDTQTDYNHPHISYMSLVPLVILQEMSRLMGKFTIGLPSFCGRYTFTNQTKRNRVILKEPAKVNCTPNCAAKLHSVWELWCCLHVFCELAPESYQLMCHC